MSWYIFKYSIDGINWIHVEKDFSRLVDVQDYINNKEIADYAKVVKILTVQSESIMRLDEK